MAVSPSAFRDALEAGDIPTLRAMWAAAAPHLPQPQSDDQAEIVMHRARTEAESITLQARAYSHRWLTERDLPSGLPDVLKPKAERMYPVNAEAVGISVNARSEWMKPAVPIIRGAMETAVLDAFAEGRRDPAFVTQRMSEAKEKAIRALFG